MKRTILTIIAYITELIALPVLILLALISRFKTRKIDIGLGPEPLINNIYHKGGISCVDL